jgi:beta-mannanase
MQQEKNNMTGKQLKRKLTSLRHVSFSKPQLAIFIIAFALIGYLLYKAFAAAPLIASIEAEQLTLPANGFVQSDSTASGGKMIALYSNGDATGVVNFASDISNFTVMARGDQCSGAPTMTVGVDGHSLINNVAVSATSWSGYSYTLGTNIGAGNHHLTVSFTNDYNQLSKTKGHSGKTTSGCDRNLYVDVANFYGPQVVATPPPTVSLSVSPASVTAGQSATLTWGSSNATTCNASGAWSGTDIGTSGSKSTGALNQSSTYSLSCSGTGGSASTNATVTVTSAPTGGTSGTSILWGALMDGDSTYAFYYGNPAPNGQPWQDAPWGNTGNTWDRFDSDAGKKASIVHYGQPAPWKQTAFYTSVAGIATSRGAYDMIDMGDDTTGTLQNMVNGTYDASIKTWAASVKAWGKPMFLRPWWEMNGTWFGWGHDAAANPALYVKAWQHWHDLVANAGATNVTWVWCPNLEFSGSTPLSQLYPGDSYVDWTCIDGYNQNSTSTSFSNLYSKTYTDILALAPTKPMMIGEIGSYEFNGAKAAWITDTLGTQLPQNFPKIKAVVWFNWRIYENGINKDWPIESSSSSQAAFKSAISSSYYAPGSSSLVNLPSLTKIQPLP